MVIMETHDICEIVRQAVFLQRVGNAEIEFDLDLPDDEQEDRRSVRWCSR